MAQVPFSGTWGLVLDVSAANVVLPELCRALWVGTAGNITGVDAAGNTVLFTNVPIGFFPMTFKQINHTGTAAAGLVAIF
jgi:hypothetical protein